MKRKYVLKNKARFYIFITVLMMTIVVAFSVTQAYGYKEPEYKVIVVRSGDTLWDIARQYNKKGDIREYIYNLKKINGLKSSEIIAGTELKIVVY